MNNIYNMKKRRRFIRILAIVMAVVLSFAWLSTTVVYADKNDKIEQLIMVAHCAGGHISKMHTAVENEERHTGDSDQHQWATSFDSVEAMISGDSEEAAKQAVVVWTGEEYLVDDYMDFMCGDGLHVEDNSIDLDPAAIPSISPGSNGANGFYAVITAGGEGHPDDTVYGDTEAVRNGERMGRSLYGYNYEVEVYVMDQPYVPPVYDDDGNIVVPEVLESGHIDTLSLHAKGFAEIWQEKGAKVYTFGLGPSSKIKNDLGDAETYKDPDGAEHFSNNRVVKDFNAGLQRSASTTIDIYDQILEHNPYYENGIDSLKNPPQGYYDEQMYAWIFHMLWNTILTLNPVDAVPEPLDETFYSVSASLTAYMNKVLSANSDEDTHSDHSLIEASTNYIGNAGAFLGFGDSDYDFNSYITSSLSKTSSSIDYAALLNIEGNNTNEMYLYARYGVLLRDMGFDDTATKMAVGSPHLIPGSVMFLSYVVSEGTDVIFSKIVTILQMMNPFQFFIADNYSLEIHENSVTDMDGGIDGATDQVVTTTNTLRSAIGSKVTSVPILQPLCRYMTMIYSVCQSIGLFVVLPLLMTLFIAQFLIRKFPKPGDWRAYNRWLGRIRRFVRITLFIIAGIPILGMIYTSTIDDMVDLVETSNSSGTQIVASTFVDFGSWVKKSRLGPPEDTTFESASTSDDNAGAVAGEASDDTYTNLRRTAAVLNDWTGATSKADVTAFGLDNMTDVGKWTTTGLTTDTTRNKGAFSQIAGLLKTYAFGEFYGASTFESDTMSLTTKNHNDKIGRQVGVNEEDPPDNKDTLYEVFSSTNETQDWTSREPDDNLSIFNHNGDYSGWRPIGLLSNGRLTAEEGGTVSKTADATKDVTYVDDPTNMADGALCSDAETGLSSISMYNYLSTKFDDAQMVIYSNDKAPSEMTKEQHYAVNIIGSGVAKILFFANALAIMFVAGLIGIYYALSMIIGMIKRSFHMILSMPFAMMGSMRKAYAVSHAVFMMLAEVLAVIICYRLVSDLLIGFVEVLEVGSHSIGEFTKFLTVGYVDCGNVLSTRAGFMIGLAITSFVLFAIGFELKKYSKVFVRKYLAVTEYIWLLVMDDETRRVYMNRKNAETKRALSPVRQKVKRTWQEVPMNFREVIFA